MNIADRESCIGRGIAAITPLETADKDFVYYLLQFNKGYLQSQGTGSTFKAIGKTALENMPVPNIPLKRQKVIGTEFRLIDRVLANQRRQLTLLDDSVKSRFIEMFGGLHDSKIFRYVAVGEVATVTSGGTPSRSKSEYWKNGSIPWIKTTELKNAEIAGSEEMITEEGLSNSSAKYIPAGSTLIAMYGQGKTRGMTGYLIKSMTVNQACAALVPNEHVNPKFLWHFMKLSYEKLRELAKGGNQPNLSINLIQRFPLLLPPINLQSRYVKFVDGVDKSKLAIQKSIDELETLKKKLMQEYFG